MARLPFELAFELERLVAAVPFDLDAFAFEPAGLIDEMQIHVVPVLLGGGIRLFDNISRTDLKLEKSRVVEAPGVTHLRFRVE